MERYLSNEDDSFDYTNKLEAFERSIFPRFSDLDGAEIEPEGVDQNQIKNKLVIRLQSILLKIIHILKDEIRIHKINIEFYKDKSKKFESQVQAKLRQVEKTKLFQRKLVDKQTELDEANKHVELAHQDIENLREELAMEREETQDHAERMDNFYRLNPPREDIVLKNILELIEVDYLTFNRENQKKSEAIKELENIIEIGKLILEQETIENLEKQQQLQ